MKGTLFLKNCKPLFFDGDKLIYARGNKVFSCFNNLSEELLFTFPKSKLNLITNKSRLFYRMFRSGVGAAIKAELNYFFVYDKKLFRYDIVSRVLVKEFNFTVGRGPLQFSIIKNIDGFTDVVCFGEYFGNHDRDPVNIYVRNSNGKWINTYSFVKGEINHIHALIPDIYRNCIWILAGDFEHSASIYKAEDNFKNVSPILTDNQNYRACVAFPLEDGILYATDSQIKTNSIRMMKQVGAGWVSEQLVDINGSCIYGTELKDYFVFSTSTEPSEKKIGKIARLLDNKPAPGILENKSDIIIYNKKSKKISIITSINKDIWPYRLFQFGSVMFPSNSEKSNILYSYNVGSKENDLSTVIYDLTNRTLR
ncbi:MULTISPECIES: hypothetical protein [unclassified Photobacterium]|uniref:hypothetical protein n=1 Tax=unclassified Photobacterium TaxID=2628852 RepID=UPI001EDD744C|nr:MULTISPECIES: hypothetical protein [unclassified Photobacterium]MCG3864919.1 hypothetical protein [Photobacterium sp. Ph6]MCG3876327.1 hypothetical protein [Photobacterium sp. Ph5]